MINRKAFKLTNKQRQSLWGYIFLLIPLIYLSITYFIPTFSAINMSFRKWAILSPAKPWVGIDNYANMLNDTRLIKSLQNTFIIVILKVPIELVIALGIALLLNRIPKFRGVYRLIYFIPFMTIGPAVAKVWKWAFMPQLGPLNIIVQNLGLPTQPFLQSPDQALFAMIAVIIWSSLGFSTVIMLAGLNQIPVTMYEAARIDGASGWQQFRYITIPLLNASIVLYTVTSTIAALQTFTLAFLLVDSPKGGYLDSIRTLSLHVYQTAFRQFKMGYASAITVGMLIIMIILTLVQLRVLSRDIKY